MTTPQRSWPLRVVDAVVDFVVGDDWFLALGVVVILCLTALVSRVVTSWWVLVAGIPLVLIISLGRATRSRSS